VFAHGSVLTYSDLFELRQESPTINAAITKAADGLKRNRPSICKRSDVTGLSVEDRLDGLAASQSDMLAEMSKRFSALEAKLDGLSK
jgi:hypothetical protein